MKKEIFVFIFLITLITFSYAQQLNYSDEELMLLAKENGLNLSEKEINEFKELIEENGIDINELDLEKIEKTLEEKNKLEVNDVKEIGKQIGINDTQIEKVIENYIELNGCDLIKQYKTQIIGQKIPEKIPYKNEIINLYLSEEFLSQINIFNGVINSIECEMIEKETYQIHIKNSTVLLDLTESFEIEKLNQKIKDKEIIVKGMNLGKKIK